MINAGANRIGTSSSLQIIGITNPKATKEKE
jgi:deoxyribose-phosphate aldolase